MSMKLRFLGSSSSGNCALLTTARCNVLIDAGLRIHRLKDSLQSCGLDLCNIDAVFLTHDHIDHTIALRYFRENCAHIPIFANRGTWGTVAGYLKTSLRWNCFETGDVWEFGDLEIQSFQVPHDASDPVGFVFGHTGTHGHKRLGWLTDLGHVTTLVKERVRQVDALALESNYERQLLMNHERRSFSLKTRVAGTHGHLSNEDAFDLLDSAELPNCRDVFLIHMSRECNTTEDAMRRFSQGSLLRPFRINPIDPAMPAPTPFEIA